jgi:nicotinate-nucleotide--dimethylbenzimidazole phosphoribosyltransferase
MTGRPGATPRASQAVAEEIRAALAAKAKPRGSLGYLEELAVRICAIRGQRLRALRCVAVVAAADHGVSDEGVSAYPAEVTEQMVTAFIRGEAAISVLARQTKTELCVVDCGVRRRVNDPAVVSRWVAAGTKNAALEAAMTPAQAEQTLAAGRAFAADLATQGYDLIAVGEMGIGNSTAAAGLVAALLDLPAEAACGPGTGLDQAGVDHKVATVARMLRRSTSQRTGPREALAELGGFEIGFLAGLMLGAADHRLVVLLDGYITGSAALLAAQLEPSAADVLIAAHRSPEPGHRHVLEALALRPLLDLDMRLGEASGAALAIPLAKASIAVLEEMATFSEAGVSDSGR